MIMYLGKQGKPKLDRKAVIAACGLQLPIMAQRTCTPGASALRSLFGLANSTLSHNLFIARHNTAGPDNDGTR
jgi:hypothetical protein